MSALSVLYLVLPFPLAFIIHDLEEMLFQHRWLVAHRESLSRRFPRMRFVIEHLSGLSTKAFAVAVLEELVVLLLATAYVLVGGRYAVEIWSALFIAFSVHLLVHLGQGLLVSGYVPGVITSILMLPFGGYGDHSIWLVMSGWEMLMWGVIGVVVMVVNLRFAHWLGRRVVS
ncbi:MAG: HXXEE domain-containing protein [Bacteroidia bacterium]|nr:HXXEE domain-containing protein [Bacteroidia bacterium]